MTKNEPLKDPKTNTTKATSSFTKKAKAIPAEPLWLSVSEAAKFGGVQTKTIRRALKKDLKFKVKNNRYSINCASLISYLHRNTKLKNKLNEHGVGMYVEEWK
jgi:hypothetical protein